MVLSSVAFEIATGGPTVSGAGVVVTPLGVTNNTWPLTMRPQYHVTDAV